MGDGCSLHDGREMAGWKEDGNRDYILSRDG